MVKAAPAAQAPVSSTSSATVVTSTTSSATYNRGDVQAAFNQGYQQGYEKGVEDGKAAAPQEPDPCMTNPHARDNGPGAPCFWWLSVKPRPTPTR
jgi:hypothetical protein